MDIYEFVLAHKKALQNPQIPESSYIYSSYFIFVNIQRSQLTHSDAGE
jgi:hypothetical protein